MINFNEEEIEIISNALDCFKFKSREDSRASFFDPKEAKLIEERIAKIDVLIDRIVYED